MMSCSTVVGFVCLGILTSADMAHSAKPLRRGVSGSTYAMFLPKKFHQLQVTSITSYRVEQVQRCCSLCIHHLGCFSLNVAANPTNGFYSCELLKGNKFETPQKLVQSHNSHHYSIQSPCESSPRQNNGTCKPQYQNNNFHYNCLPNTFGRYCERAPCKSNPCKNNGTCKPSKEGLTLSCSCPGGIYGKLCDSVLEELTLQGKTAVQSSTGWGGTADRAIDGNTNSNFFAGSCMHTLWEVNPWWRVDLGAIYEVYRVKLYNGLDGGNHFKLSNFEIRIGNSLNNNGNNNALWVSGKSLVSKESGEYTCDLAGQYVNIRNMGTRYLGFCELELWALDPITQ